MPDTLSSSAVVYDETYLLTTDNKGLTPLHQACRKQDVPTVKALLAAAKDLFTTDQYQGYINQKTYALSSTAGGEIIHYGAETALYLTCELNGNIELINILLAGGADVNLADASGKTPLMAACELEVADPNAPLALVTRLVQHQGIDLNAEDAHSNTALSGAFGWNRYPLAEHLLAQEGISPFLDGCDGAQSLFLACRMDRLPLVRHILDNLESFLNQAMEVDTETTPETKAKNIKEIIQDVVNQQHSYWDSNTHSERLLTPLQLAILLENQEIITVLLQHKRKLNANIQDYDGSTALSLAFRQGNINLIAQLFVIPGINPILDGFHGKESFYSACRFGFDRLVTFFLDKITKIDEGFTNVLLNEPRRAWPGHGFDVNRQYRPLETAYLAGHYNIVLALIKHPLTEVNITIEPGINLLSKVIIDGNTAIAEALLQRRLSTAIINATDHEGYTALDHALRRAVDGQRDDRTFAQDDLLLIATLIAHQARYRQPLPPQIPRALMDSLPTTTASSSFWMDPIPHHASSSRKRGADPVTPASSIGDGVPALVSDDCNDPKRQRTYSSSSSASLHLFPSPASQSLENIQPVVNPFTPL